MSDFIPITYMETIWKYPIPISSLDEDSGSVLIKMPKNAEILTVQVQNGDPTIWACIASDFAAAQQELRKFRIYGTGHVIDSRLSLRYIGTVQLHGGKLVLHVFEER